MQAFVVHDIAEPLVSFDDSASSEQVPAKMKAGRFEVVGIRRDGRVGGIVSRSDLEKPRVRMWLFGMMTLIEIRFTRLIGRLSPEDSWKQFLSASRNKKAEELLREGTRRNQSPTLLDYL